jgi:hypothetical protein
MGPEDLLARPWRSAGDAATESARLAEAVGALPTESLIGSPRGSGDEEARLAIMEIEV